MARRRYRSSWDPPDPDDADDLDRGLDDTVDFDLPQASEIATWARLPLPPKAAPRPGWKQQLDEIGSAMRGHRLGWPARRELHYVLAPADTSGRAGLAVDVGCRQQKRNGAWRQIATFTLSSWEIERLPDAADRQILAMLSGGGLAFGGYWRAYPGSPFLRFNVPTPLLGSLLPLIVQTGRASVQGHFEPAGEWPRLTWDDGPPWEFYLDVARAESGKHYRVTGALRRAAERLDLTGPLLVLPGGFVCLPDRVARVDDAGAFAWIAHLRRVGEVRVPVDQADRFLHELVRMPGLPPHALPSDLAYETFRPTPRPRVRVERAPREWPPDLLRLELSFDYDGVVIPAHPDHPRVLDPRRRRLIVRAGEAEQGAHARLAALGVRERAWTDDNALVPGHAVVARAFSRVVGALLGDGWHVEADGKLFRQPGAFRLSVTTGIDWFELHGEVEFGDTSAPLPALLAALRRGETTVLLGDGTRGLVPEEWLQRYAPLAALGSPEGAHLRFSRAQVGFLDALLAAQPEISCDERFARARDELQRFAGVAPADPPASFTGRLRGYQREGLGWLHFLRRFAFGGCLADDMGLGKTVMVLALLESRRVEGVTRPSLVVVPRSLVFNWKQEATRFAPALRVLDHTGVGRRPEGDHLADHDVVLTTYGTLRRDVGHLKDVAFDYVVLDEAQAIKNPTTDAAKAARLLRADHRLALSGTPVENHLGELWSLFEFLNPGMLGAASALRLDGAAGRSPDEATRELLARALRPFVLRRTKAEVAPELPPRVEQTIYCELEPLQRQLYDELRDHYRRTLLGRIERDGINRSKIVVLEALLRLRQAACHPGLIDGARVDEPAGKLDVLLSRLTEVVAEGHKALVFSQFTSFLAIVRRRLDRERVPYAYLDGGTRDRQARVASFQDDPDCPLFLVSLKAGGLGLNLTAAEHVFLLDPWWNPAAEAQAIDRAHRIGQTRHVLAFRLIARDTVEEKIVALQAEKRELAEAIINEQNSLIRTLTRDDLELLLG